MSGKRNVSVCRGHELLNALYNLCGELLRHCVLFQNNVFLMTNKKQAAGLACMIPWNAP